MTDDHDQLTIYFRGKIAIDNWTAVGQLTYWSGVIDEGNLVITIIIVCQKKLMELKRSSSPTGNSIK